MWSVHPWRYSEPDWTTWTSYSSWSCFVQRGRTRWSADLPSNLNYSVILRKLRHYITMQSSQNLCYALLTCTSLTEKDRYSNNKIKYFYFRSLKKKDFWRWTWNEHISHNVDQAEKIHSVHSAALSAVSNSMHSQIRCKMHFLLSPNKPLSQYDMLVTSWHFG